jgi:hypothetical protein
VSADRRAVRALASFFEDLDRQLPSFRGPNGEPSTNDFQAFELIRIIEQFALGFDQLPELIAGRLDYRIMVVSGVLVPRLSVVGQIAPDGAVELIQLDIDLDASW